MLVLCVGMYRSCSTWQYGVASLILERHRDGRRLGFIEGARFDELKALEQAAEGWRVMKAHDAHPCFDEVLHDGRALGIFAYRDVRDVAQSWMHMTDASFADITGSFLNLCLDNDRFWRSRPNILVQPYERIVGEPARAVREIAHHVGVPIDEAEAQAIADEMSRDANRKRIEKLNEKLRAEGSDLVPQDLSLFDPNSLLHWNHIRDGRSGIWREQFDPAECRALADLCGAWLIDRGYEPDLAWAGADYRPAPKPAAPRVSYAAIAEDIRLDRVFGDHVGAYLDLGSNHPTVANRTQFFADRGWRGVNSLGPTADLDAFRRDRPGDLNLAVAIDPVDEAPTDARPSPTTRSLASLASQYLLSRPDLVVIEPSADVRVEPILASLPWDTWSPQVFLIADDSTTSPDWEANLLDRGYVAAFSDGANRYYLRTDLADQAEALARPIVPADRFERGDLVVMRAERDRWVAQLQAERLAHADALAAKDAERAQLDAERTASIHGLIGERDWMLNLRDHAVLEREWFRAEMTTARDKLTESDNARLAEQAERRAEQAAWASDRAGLVAERIMIEGQRDGFAAELAELRDRLAHLEAERDDLRRDCATWEAEASRRARLAHEERQARVEAEQKGRRSRPTTPALN